MILSDLSRTADEVRSAYRIFCNLQDEIKELDKQLDEFFKQNTDNQTLQNPPKLKTGKNQNTPDFEVEKYALQIFGVNLNEIPGFGRDALLNFIAEVGDGIHRFHSAKAFAKWLGFTPNNKASGGKILSKRTLKNKSPLPNNFRMVANAIGNIKTSNPLTNFFNKIAFRSSRISAVTATARKVAVIVYNMLTKKEEFQSEKVEGNKQKIKLQQIKKIKKNLHKFDISLQDLGWNM